MVLLRSLITHGRIRTTRAKAKAIQPMVDSLITSVKKKTSSAMQSVRSVLVQEQYVQKLLDMVKTRFIHRSSGYTRMLYLGQRKGDGAEEVLLEFVDKEPEKLAKTSKASKTVKADATVQEAEIIAPKPSKTRKQST